jgi:hypothetical protein
MFQQSVYPRLFGRSALLIMLLTLGVLSAGASLPQPRRTLFQSPATAASPTAATLPQRVQVTLSADIGLDDPTYHLTPDDPAGDTAANPGIGLVATFRATGMEVRAGANVWSIDLVAWGRGLDLQPVPALGLRTVRANRLEYEHGSLTAWYVNGPLGVQQGWTLTEPPARVGSAISAENAPLTLALVQGGTLRGLTDSDRLGLTLSDAEGTVRLRYTGLSAYDTNGRMLQAELAVDGERVFLQVDDSGAEYPVVIDPFVQQAKLFASDGKHFDYFGSAVAISGDTIVVGAYHSSPGGVDRAGTAYVFVKPSSGWTGNLTQSARLTASDKRETAYFGLSVAIDGEVVVVGADFGGYVNCGKAYVFVKPSYGWVGDLTENARLNPGELMNNNDFGGDVAVSGDTIVVADPYARTPSKASAGKAYVFVKPVGGWTGNLTPSAKLFASDAESYDDFGWSVAISGDTIVAGSFYASPGVTWAGAAYVFAKPVGGWTGDLTESAKLTASDKSNADHLGVDVAISGDVVVAGACDLLIGSDGAVYVFVKPSGGWRGSLTESAKLVAFKQTLCLGQTVSVSGDTVVAGTENDGGYVFVKPSGGWQGRLTQEAWIWLPADEAGYCFACNAAVSGDSIVFRASESAYVFGPSRDTSSRYTYLPLIRK